MPAFPRSSGAGRRKTLRSHAGFVWTIVVFSRVVSVKSQEPTSPQAGTRKVAMMPQQELLKKLMGKWEGSSRTWFEPDKLADESQVSGEFSDVLAGCFVRHTSQGTIQAKPRRGEELIAFNAITKVFQSSWVDDFHMNYAILYSEGESTARGFRVPSTTEIAADRLSPSAAMDPKLVRCRKG